ncbi:MAG TPA: VanZ family protein [Marinilabiliales bacterium]|jgi:VanZ family protein|nr:MAG: hypothetical protein A2W84_05900 [Bacteroidetes bacterium GWC2_40_13]HBO76381.1 VanZ family protein [Marinilabiliales bacterium]
MTIIGYLCLTPADDFKKVPIEIPYFDKAVHFGLFLVLALIMAGLNQTRPNSFHKLAIPAFAFMYGVFIEIVQSKFTTTRSGDWRDVLADTLGILVGIWLFKKLNPKWQWWFQ